MWDSTGGASAGIVVRAASAAMPLTQPEAATVVQEVPGIVHSLQEERTGAR